MSQGTQPCNLLVPTGNWSFVGITVDRDTNQITFYVNDKTETQILSPNFLPFSGQLNALGTYLNVSTRFMNGLIDEAHIYNRSITSAEAQELFSMGPEPKVNVFKGFQKYRDLTSNQTMLFNIEDTSESGNTSQVICRNFFANDYLLFQANCTTNINVWTTLGKPVFSTGVWNSQNYTTTLTLIPPYNGTLSWKLSLPPSPSNCIVTPTTAGRIATFAMLWTDEKELAGGGYIFSTNNTGQWTNSSWTPFNSNPTWTNNTLTLNSNVGTVVDFREYANNSANLWGVQSYMLTTSTSSNNPTPSPTPTVTSTPKLSKTPTSVLTTSATPTPPINQPNGTPLSIQTLPPSTSPNLTSSPNVSYKISTQNLILSLIVVFLIVACGGLAYRKGYIEIEPEEDEKQQITTNN
jgi:hypothetical protein